MATPAMSVESTARSSIMSVVELFAKLAGILAIVAYVFGVLTVHAFLDTLATFEMSVAQVRYIEVGLWAISEFVIVFGAPAICVSYLTKRTRKRGWPRTVLHVAALVIVILLFIGLFFLHYSFVLGGRNIAVIFMISVVAVGLALAKVIRVIRQALRSAGDASWHSQPKVIAWLVFLLVLTPVYPITYGKYAYPTIPTEYGGAKPNRLQLLISREGVEGARKIGIQFADEKSSIGGPAWTEQIEILFEGEQGYLVRTAPAGRIAELKKEIVLAAVTPK